jgi:hypothetical protein
MKLPPRSVLASFVFDAYSCALILSLTLIFLRFSNNYEGHCKDIFADEVQWMRPPDGRE